MKNLHISTDEKIIFGICAGIGESFGINANIVRGAFLLSLLFGFSGFFIYLVLAVILPKGDKKPEEINISEEEDDKEKMNIRRSWKTRMLAGVCGGFANYFGWDVSLIRIGFVAMSFAGGIGIFLYLFFWFIFPNEE